MRRGLWFAAGAGADLPHRSGGQRLLQVQQTVEHHCGLGVGAREGASSLETTPQITHDTTKQLERGND